MYNGNKPAFHTWEPKLLADLTHDLWDENVKLRNANEQLRMDNKDLSTLLRKQFMQEDDLK
jgi:hypothetical protein